MVLKKEKKNVRHAHQVLNCALRSLRMQSWLVLTLIDRYYLGPFSVEEEEKDLSEDLLRLKVNFGEVLEEKEEDAALVDFLSQLCL